MIAFQRNALWVEKHCERFSVPQERIVLKPSKILIAQNVPMERWW